MTWLYHELDNQRIPVRDVWGLNYVIQVPNEWVAEAIAVLNQPIGEHYIGGVAKVLQVTVRDLADDHPFFTSPESFQNRHANKAQMTVDDVLRVIAGGEDEGVMNKLRSLQPVFDVNYPAEEGLLCFEILESELLTRLGIRENELQSGLGGPEYVIWAKFAKTGGIYRYRYLSRQVVLSLMIEAAKSNAGVEGSSIGSLFHELVKVPAKDGDIICEKAQGGGWVAIQPKT